MPCEVSMVLWSESRGRKIIPACFYWQNVRRSTEKSCPFMMVHYPNCNSPAASRPPLRRSSAHLNRPAFCAAWKRSFTQPADSNTTTATMPLPRWYMPSMCATRSANKNVTQVLHSSVDSCAAFKVTLSKPPRDFFSRFKNWYVQLEKFK